MKIRYFLTKIISSLLVIFIVISATFLLLRVLPGGPFDSEKRLPPKVKINIEKKYKLDQPLLKQYLHYMKSTSKLDLGPSYFYPGKSVNEIIKKSLPYSLKVGILSLIFTIISSIFLAKYIYNNKNHFLAKFLTNSLYLAVGTPTFLIGALLIMFFSVNLRILPAALLETPLSYVLPVLTLSIPSISFLSKLMIESMNDVENTMYYRNAKLNNIKSEVVLKYYIIRNSLVPFVTAIGPISAFMITGSFVVESIFSIPGMGKMFILSIINRDYPIVCGLTIVYTIVLISINMLIDFTYPLIDKRIKYE
ncbi:ABC transporter permease [bacterium]|nr:ABC transporter permease [bacterium]|tara:strand:+ start:20798 stop:21718 length:921 start_codon:yes stop_codon:yes gene_type:complete